MADGRGTLFGDFIILALSFGITGAVANRTSGLLIGAPLLLAGGLPAPGTFTSPFAAGAAAA